jgi:hypothetical protein
MIVTQEQYKAIETYAVEHYGKNGWDMIYECMALADIQEIADRHHCEDFPSLFAEVEATAKLWHEFESDIQNA